MSYLTGLIFALNIYYILFWIVKTFTQWKWKVSSQETIHYQNSVLGIQGFSVHSKGLNGNSRHLAYLLFKALCIFEQQSGFTVMEYIYPWTVMHQIGQFRRKSMMGLYLCYLKDIQVVLEDKVCWLFMNCFCKEIVRSGYHIDVIHDTNREF